MTQLEGHRTQNITQNDIDRGCVRFPAATRSLFPEVKTTLQVEVNGRAFEDVPWDPMIAEDRVRSGQLRFGVFRMRSLFSPGEQWVLQRTDSGYRLSGPVPASA